MSLYKRNDSEIWWASISRPGFPRVREPTGESDRKKAQRVHDLLKADLWRHETPARGDTWGKAVAAWCDIEERSDSELMSLAKLGRRFKDRQLSSITATSFNEALAFCQTAGTYTRYRTMICAILKLADHPLKLPTRRDKKQKPRDWLTREQWTALQGQLPEHLLGPATFAIETGLRQHNVLGLEWDRVDLKRKLVWIEAEDMKADVPISIPLNERALAVLNSRIDNGSAYVFVYRDKRIAEIKTAFIAACVRAGIGTLKKWVDADGKKHQHYTGFTWHGLRHTWATWHVQNETPLDVLQKLGGWSDLRMVMKYSHHTPGHLARYADNSGAQQ